MKGYYNNITKILMVIGLFVMQFQVVNSTETNTVNAATFTTNPGNMSANTDGYGYVKVASTTNPYNGEQVYQLWHNAKARLGTTFYVDQISGTLNSTGNRNTTYLLGRSNSNSINESRVFQPVEYSSEFVGDVLEIQINLYNTLLLSSNGELWYTGNGAWANTVGTLPNTNIFEKVNPATFDGKVVDMKSFDGGTLLLTDQGTLYFSGNRGAELFGSGFGDKTEFTIAPNPDGKTVEKIWSDETAEADIREHQFIVKTTDGNYYGVGEGGSSAAAGLNRAINSNGWLPVMEDRAGVVQAVQPNSIIDFKTYSNYLTYALRSDGTIWISGLEGFGVVNGTLGTGTYSSNVFKEFPDWGNDNIALYEGDVTALVGKDLAGSEDLWVAGENYRDLGTVTPTETYLVSTCATGGPAVCILNGPTPLIRDNNFFNSTNWNKTAPFQSQYIIGGYDESLAVDSDGFLRAAGYVDSANTMAYNTQAIFPPVVAESTIRTQENFPTTSDTALGYNITTENSRTNARINGEYKLYETIYLAMPTAEFDGFGTAFEGALPNTIDPNIVTMGPIRGTEYAFDADGTTQYDVHLSYEIFAYDTTTGTALNAVAGYSGDVIVNTDLASVDLSGIATGDYVLRMTRYTTNADGEQFKSTTVDEPFTIVNAPVLSVPSFTEINQGNAFSVMDNVTVTDFEDDDATLLTQVIATPSTIDTNVAGVYTIDYSVTDSDGNSVSAMQTVLVNDGSYIVGENYIIRALDFAIHRKNVDVNNVRVDASVELIDKFTGEVQAVTSDSVSVTYGTPSYLNAPTQLLPTQDYPITFAIAVEPTVTVSITATVSNNAPEIIGADYIEVEPGAVFDPLLGVSAIDTEDGDLTTSLVVSGTVDTSVAGVYVLDYSVVDSDGNESSVKRTVVVKGDGLVIGTDFIIMANDFSQPIGEVDPAMVTTFANVHLYDKAGNELTLGGNVNIIYGTPSYENALTTPVDTTTVYPITFVHTTDTTTTITIDGSVTNYAPVISGETYIEVDLDAVVDTTAGLTVTDVEDGDNVLPLTTTPLFTSIPGVYKVDVSATDSDGNTTTITRVYVVKGEGLVIGDTYVIMADDFARKASEATVATVIDDGNVRVYEKATGDMVDPDTNVNVTYATPDYTQAINQTIVFERYPITYTVIGDANATITIDASVVIDEAVFGTDYALLASDFVIDIADALAYMDADTTDVLTSADAKAVHSVDGTNGTPEVLSNGILEQVGSYKVTINVAEEPDLQKEITVIVKDSNTVLGENYGLKAENFKITVDQAAAYMDADITDVIGESGAKVVAWELATNNSADVAVSSNGILATEGVYPVEIYVVNEPTTTKTVYVTVTGDNGVLTGDEGILLVANNFTVDLTQGEVLPTTINEFITLANVEAIYTANGTKLTDLSNLTVVPTTMAGYIDGLYQVTFTLADPSGDAVVTVNALVIDENSGTGIIDGVNYAVTADDFIIDKRTGSGYLDSDYDSSAKIVSAANAKAINADTMEVDLAKTLTSNPASFVGVTAGVYETTYTIDGSTVAGIANVLIIDDTSVVGADGVVINGYNFTINTAQASVLTDIEVIVNGNVSAFSKDTAQIYDVVINPTDLAAINAGISGVYPVLLSVVGSSTTKTIYVTVTDGEGVLTGDGGYLLNAYDFTVDLTQGELLPTTINEFVTLANAKITNTQTGEVVTDYSNLTTNPTTMIGYSDGLYDVTFTLADPSGDAVLTVKALVIDENTGTGVIDGVNYAVSANDFVIDKRTGSGYIATDYDSSVKIVEVANAMAINADTYEEDLTKLVVSNPASFVDSAAGVYETTYTIDTTTITGVANVLVIDDNSTVGADAVVINGDNFTVTSAVATTLTAADIIINGIVSAFNKDSAQVYDVVVSATDVANINSGVSGVYPVELSVDGSDTTKTIFVTVTDNNGVLTGDANYLLQAYDFTVDLTQGELLPTTISEFVTLANAKITNTQTGEVITDYSNLTVLPTTMLDYTDGLYDVTFTLADASGDAILTVKALVIDENTGTGVIDGVSFAVSANDFVIDKRTGSGYLATDYDSSAKIVSAANAMAINADTYEEDASKLVVSNPASFVDSVAGVYETTYTIDTTTITGIANVFIIDDSSTVGTDSVVINGSNFIVTSDVAMTLTDADVITTGNVSAFNIDTTEVYDVVVSVTDLAAINTGVSGVYPVELSVDGSTTTKVIYVTVIGDGVLTGDGGYLLQAYDFTVDLIQGELLPTTINEFVILANAKITNTQTGEVVTDYSNLTTNPVTMLGYSDGLYDVTFTLTDASGDAVLTVKALVIDENTGTGVIDGVNYAVSANDFVIDKRTGSTYVATDYDTSAKIVSAANAMAINADTYEEDLTKLVVSNPGSFVDSVAGVYETTYTIDTTTITGIANVLVIDDSSTVGTDGVVINGNNFVVTSDVAMTLTNTDVITNGNVSAFNMDTTEVYDVVVNATDLVNINSGVSGVYPVELSVDGSSTTKTIFVTVIDNNGVLTGDANYLLQAYDFTVDLTQGEVLPTTISEFVMLANAKITNTQTGEVVTDYSNLTTNPTTMLGYSDGLYDVTFTLADASGDAVLTVKALVIDENTGTGVIDGVNYAVSANDFVIDKRTGSTYVSTDYDTSAKIVEAANAMAINADTYEEDVTKLVVSNPASFVDSVAGVYETTYTIDGTTITGIANVFVIDDSSTVGTDGVVINGNNFVVTSDVAMTLTDADVISNGNVSAFNLDSALVYDVVVSATDLASINSGISGVYPVELSVDSSDTTKTIFVTVVDENGVLTGDSEYLLQAYDFTVDLTQGEVLPTTINEFVTLANVKITNTQTGEVVTDYSNLSVVPMSMASYVDGLYDVTFTLVDESGDAVVTVKALVIDENTGTGVIDGVNYAVVANDFVIDKRTGSGYVATDYDTSAKIVAAASAMAINADTYEEDLTKLVVSSLASFVDSVAGVYETTYTIDTTTIASVANVFVIDDSSVVGEDGIVINGSNFVISSDVAMVLTDADVITNGVVSAFNKDSAQIYDVDINVTDLAAVNTGISGVYPVELSVFGSTTSKTIYVTVTDENSVITDDGKHLLIANNFIVDLTKGETLPTTIEEFVDLAGVKIISTETGEMITDYTNLSTNPSSLANYGDGFAVVKFTYINDEFGLAENTIVVRIIDSLVEVDQTTYILSGTEAIINLEDLANANLVEEFNLELVVLELGEVNKNYDLDDAVFTVDGNPVEDLPAGIYLVDVMLDDLYVQLPLVIADENTVVDNGKVLFVDNPYLQYTDVEARGLTFEDLVNDANARAFVIDTQEPLVITTLTQEVVDTIFAGTPGTYEVSMKVNPEAFVIVEVIETDDLVSTGATDYLIWFVLVLLLMVSTRKIIKIRK